MFAKNINFVNFVVKKKNPFVKKNLKFILKENNQVILSLRKSYKDTFNKKTLSFFKKKKDYRIIGMGGSNLGSQAIYDFLKKKVKNKLSFVDNFQEFKKKNKKQHYNNHII